MDTEKCYYLLIVILLIRCKAKVGGGWMIWNCMPHISLKLLLLLHSFVYQSDHAKFNITFSTS